MKTKRKILLRLFIGITINVLPMIYLLLQEKYHLFEFNPSIKDICSYYLTFNIVVVVILVQEHFASTFLQEKIFELALTDELETLMVIHSYTDDEVIKKFIKEKITKSSTIGDKMFKEELEDSITKEEAKKAIKDILTSKNSII